MELPVLSAEAGARLVGGYTEVYGCRKSSEDAAGDAMKMTRRPKGGITE